MLQSTLPTTAIDQPLVHFGREVCGDLANGLRREWIVTNGLGGYASSTLAGVNTRRYHGLLIAALTPPVERTVLVGGLIEWVTYSGRRYPLSNHEYGDGTIDPHGYRHLQSFMVTRCASLRLSSLSAAMKPCKSISRWLTRYVPLSVPASSTLISLILPTWWMVLTETTSPCAPTRSSQFRFLSRSWMALRPQRS